MKVNVKEWKEMKAVERYMSIFRAARQNDATLKIRNKKSLQALACE